jgi:hypothetical protein
MQGSNTLLFWLLAFRTIDGEQSNRSHVARCSSSASSGCSHAKQRSGEKRRVEGEASGRAGGGSGSERARRRDNCAPVQTIKQRSAVYQRTPAQPMVRCGGLHPLIPAHSAPHFEPNRTGRSRSAHAGDVTLRVQLREQESSIVYVLLCTSPPASCGWSGTPVHKLVHECAASRVSCAFRMAQQLLADSSPQAIVLTQGRCGRVGSPCAMGTDKGPKSAHTHAVIPLRRHPRASQRRTVRF